MEIGIRFLDGELVVTGLHCDLLDIWHISRPILRRLRKKKLPVYKVIVQKNYLDFDKLPPRRWINTWLLRHTLLGISAKGLRLGEKPEHSGPVMGVWITNGKLHKLGYKEGWNPIGRWIRKRIFRRVFSACEEKLTGAFKHE